MDLTYSIFQGHSEERKKHQCITCYQEIEETTIDQLAKLQNSQELEQRNLEQEYEFLLKKDKQLQQRQEFKIHFNRNEENPSLRSYEQDIKNFEANEQAIQRLKDDFERNQQTISLLNEELRSIIQGNVDLDTKQKQTLKNKEKISNKCTVQHIFRLFLSAEENFYFNSWTSLDRFWSNSNLYLNQIARICCYFHFNYNANLGFISQFVLLEEKAEIIDNDKRRISIYGPVRKRSVHDEPEKELQYGIMLLCAECIFIFKQLESHFVTAKEKLLFWDVNDKEIILFDAKLAINQQYTPLSITGLLRKIITNLRHILKEFK